MRINVNLASQKYEDAREFYLRWGAALGLALVLTIALVFLASYNYRSTAADRKYANALRDKISRLDDERQQAEAVLNRPENQDVRDQSRFWNDVIDKKSFSWTQLFSDLEKIMPSRTFVLSVQPTLTPEKRLQLRLMVAGEKPDNAVELASKMERSERFRSTEIVSETVRPATQGTPSVVEFEISTYYTPASPARAAAAKEGI